MFHLCIYEIYPTKHIHDTFITILWGGLFIELTLILKSYGKITDNDRHKDTQKHSIDIKHYTEIRHQTFYGLLVHQCPIE